MTATPSAAVSTHRPKVEFFDLAARTNTDRKGFVRPVDRYHREEWGLYMARRSDHEQFHYIESWLIPTLGIRITIFHYNPGHERDQNYYVDIADVTPGDAMWTSVDHYLDLVVRTGREVELLDVDELLAAHAAGYIDSATAQRTIERAVAAVDGIAGHGHSLEGWLASQGMLINWR